MSTEIQKTSLDAYFKVKSSGGLDKSRWHAYDILARYGPMTASEAMEVAEKENPNISHARKETIGRRISDLFNLGIVDKVGERPSKTTGYTSTLYATNENMPDHSRTKRHQTWRDRALEAERRIDDLKKLLKHSANMIQSMDTSIVDLLELVPEGSTTGALMNKEDQKREAARTQGKARSPHWETVRKAHLKAFPNCAVCGGTKDLQTHHKKPFHLHPELELDPANLITLCEKGGRDCHLTFGHAGDFKGYNPDVEADSASWNRKFKQSRALGAAGADGG